MKSALVSWLREFVDVTGFARRARRDAVAARLRAGVVERRASGSTIGVERRRTRSDPDVDDAVLDFEITANRPDALSVIGLAREAATAYSLPLQAARPEAPAARDPRPMSPSRSKRRTSARVMPRPSPTSPSRPHPPGWRRGCRPPASAPSTTSSTSRTTCCSSSASRCTRSTWTSSPAKRLRIRRAKKGERIKTLDGTDRALDPEMLVIADADKAQAIAGVMGGGLSEVSSSDEDHRARERLSSTRRASASPASGLGSKTEASARFERGADINAPVKGLERAIALLEEIGAGRARGGVVDRYPAPGAAANARRFGGADRADARTRRSPMPTSNAS